MHMADALVSPAVGGVMTAVSAGILAYSTAKMKKDFDPARVPLTGVMGAFVFAAQMINFALPGTGSSGHIGGAVLLAALLGPYAAFSVLACVLFIQAFLFADGGLLAFGCNLFNMGFFGCFITYPLIFRPLIRKKASAARVMTASVLSCIVSLQLGAFCVVLETLCSGITELPFAAFALLMQPIHLAIGAVEGVLTGLLLIFLYQARPELTDAAARLPTLSVKAVAGTLAIGAFVIGGGLSLLASEKPDGLEWSMERTAGTAELSGKSAVHERAAHLQEKSALLPDYGHEKLSDAAGTSAAGTAGSAAVLLLAGGLAFLLKPGKREQV